MVGRSLYIQQSEHVLRAGGDGADDPAELPGGEQDEEVPARPDGQQGPAGEADGRGAERDEGTEAVRLGALLLLQDPSHQGGGDQGSQEGEHCMLG